MITKIIEELSSYPHWAIGGTSDTKKTSTANEQFVQNVFTKHGCHVHKMGTQQAPDFFLMTPEIGNEILKYNTVLRNKDGEVKCYKSGLSIPNLKPISKSIILKWHQSEFNLNKTKIIWVSVKSRAKNNPYRINDEVVKPNGETIYINFDGLNQKIWVAIEKDIASNCGITQKMVDEDAILINKCKSDLLHLWGRTFSPNTILRARGISGEQMNINSSLNDITELFKSAGFKE